MVNELAVAETLRRRMLTDISDGDLAPGAKLGSERELAERYGVSRSTLRQVLAALDEAGLIRRVAGRSGGTFVARAKVERDPTHPAGVPAYLARQGYAAGTRVLSTQMTGADETTRSALRMDRGALVFDLRRLRLADGTPFSLDHARFPAERFPGLLELPLGGSVYELLEEHYGTTISEAEEQIEVVHATDDEAAMLATSPGAPLLAIVRTAYDSAGDPIEYSQDLLRADRVRIRMRTPGSGLRGDELHDVAHFATISPV